MSDSLLHIFQPHTALRRRVRHLAVHAICNSNAIIPNRHTNLVIHPQNQHLNCSIAAFRQNAMSNGIFHKRLDNQRGDAALRKPIFHRYLKANPMRPMTGLFNRKHTS